MAEMAEAQSQEAQSHEAQSLEAHSQEAQSLRPYVPRLLEEWLGTDPARTHRAIPGSLAFVDLSGFTALTERLARKGKVGAEEMSDALNATFGQLMEVADRDGADLVKWGGDAILLLFEGEEHASRACRAANDMRTRLRDVGRIRTSSGTFQLRMSVGIHSDTFDFFLVGDPDLHRELLVTGPAASEAARLEGIAQAGQIAIGSRTARLVGGRHVGDPLGPDAWLLKSTPDVAGDYRRTRPGAAPDFRGFIPVAIREHLLADVGGPEHRAVAVAFVQFAGTDDMLRREGPEATGAALDDMVRNVSHAAHSHGVTFFESDINVDGGKIMLVSGAPKTNGHDADRLLRTARRIVDHAGALPLRVGVNSGRVFSSDFGPAFRRTYSIKGDAVNTAARVMGKAQPGEVLATVPVVDAAETRFAGTPVGPFQMKGKAQPVPAVLLGPILTEREHTVVERPLVGREAELAQLMEALDSARSGHGRVVELLGEPGIGKSRLVQEVVRLATEVTDLQVTCDEYEQTTAYGAFRDLLRGRFGLTERTPPATAHRTVRRVVVETAPDLEPWLPLLGDVLGLKLPETDSTRDLEEQFRKARMEVVVVDLLGRLLPGPTILVVDDAQYMDAAAADLLNRLAHTCTTRPWLLIVGRRDQPVGWVPDDNLPTQPLRLLPLTGDAALELAAEAAAGDRVLPRPVLEALAARAAGNPLFLEALAAQVGPAGTVDDLPATIEDLVSAQIDQLAPGQRSVLRHAAVLGSQFATDELVDLLHDQRVALDDAMRASLAAFLLWEDSGRQMRFRHGLIRETAYDGLAYRTRQALHSQVAAAMERNGRGETEPELLSLHCLHAGSYAKALAYARRSGDNAKAMYANTEAVELYRRATEAGTRLPRSHRPELEIAQAYEAMGDCLFKIGLTDQAAEAYAKALTHVRGKPLDGARVVGQQAFIDQRLRHFTQSLRRLRRAMTWLEHDTSPSAERARSVLERHYAWSRLLQGRTDEAMAWGELCLASARRSGDPGCQAMALSTLYGFHLMAGQTPTEPLGQQALEIYVEIGDLDGQAGVTNNLAYEAFVESRWSDAADQFRIAAEINRRLGDTVEEARARGNLAELLVDQGRAAEAVAPLEEAMVAARAADDVDLEAFLETQLGRALARSGRPRAGILLLNRARSMLIEIDAPQELRRLDLARVEARLLDDDPEEALRLADELMAGPEAEAYRIVPELNWLRGHALLRLRLPADAEAEFRAGLAAATEAGELYPAAVCAMGLAALGVPDADERRADATRVLAELGVVGLPFDR